MKKSIVIILAVVFALSIFQFVKADEPEIFNAYVIKDPYPSKIAWAMSQIVTPYFITLRIDEDKTYWYTMNFIEPTANTSLAWAVIKSITGTANSGAYDVGSDTTNAYYKEAVGVQ